MHAKQVPYTLALLAAVAGLTLMVDALTSPHTGADFFSHYSFEIGLFTLLLAPFILQRYLWLAIQLALTLGFFVWLHALGG